MIGFCQLRRTETGEAARGILKSQTLLIEQLHRRCPAAAFAARGRRVNLIYYERSKR